MIDAQIGAFRVIELDGNFVSFDSIQDCMDEPSNLELEGDECWEFVNKCVSALCEAQIITCD